MTLFLQDPDVTLYHGDALETLRELPTGSVDMVAASPPFYGLRDYGTGTWEGGDESCDHKASTGEPRKFTNGRGEGTDDDYAGSNLRSWTTRDGTTFKDECGRCGARRVDRQIGLEETPDQWVTNLVQVFRECRRVLADHGTLWVEIGDSYSGMPRIPYGDQAKREHGTDDDRIRKPLTAGCKQKDLVGQPWLLAFALRADGWYLRSEIIWARPNPMPESVTDRPTKSHSTIFLLSKQPRYYYDQEAAREGLAESTLNDRRQLDPDFEPTRIRNRGGRTDGFTSGSGLLPANPAGRNGRSVWTIPTEPTPFAHFATWPQKLVGRMIQAGTSQHGKCPECGKPWARELSEASGGTKGKSWNDHAEDEIQGQRTGHGQVVYATYQRGTTLGWSPSCAHDTPPVPCVVLDPFAGSGTTLLVARNHQRHSIGIELNPDYCQIAAKRLQQLSLLT